MLPAGNIQREPLEGGFRPVREKAPIHAFQAHLCDGRPQLRAFVAQSLFLFRRDA